MSEAPTVTVGSIVANVIGWADAAWTQGTLPSSINQVQLNANLTALTAAIGPFLPNGLATVAGAVGGAASGVGLSISIGQLYTSNNIADRLSAGLQALGGVAGVIASNPFAPPQVKIAFYVAQGLLTIIGGNIGRNADYTNQKIDELTRILNRLDEADQDLMSTWDSEGWPDIDAIVNGTYQQGITWFRPSDPLILDLDGDGIELSTSSSTVLFDHNADGLKTGTQWAKADDGILVRDLNGNGTIDSGRELFGDQTQITTTNALGQSVTTLATNGFVALRALDADANGVAGADANSEPVSTSSTQIAQNVNFTQNTFCGDFNDQAAWPAQQVMASKTRQGCHVSLFDQRIARCQIRKNARYLHKKVRCDGVIDQFWPKQLFRPS